MARTSSIDVSLRLRGQRTFQADVARTAARLEALGARGSRALASFAKYGDRLTNFGRSMTRSVTLPIAAAGAVAGTLAVNFDKSMRNVNSIAQLSEERFQSLSQQVLDLAGPTAQTPQVLSEGLYDLVSSGFDAEESMRILESSAKAATAGLSTAATSTAAVAAVLNAYRLKAGRAADVSDVLFRTVDQGVITFEELASNLGDVLPFASALGVDLRQVGAAIATMTKAGISAPETMTRIKAVMSTMLKPGEALQKVIRGLGFESGEAMIKQLGFLGTLEALSKATGGSKEGLAKMFPNIRALGGALALTGKNSKAAKDDLESVGDAHGALDKALGEQSKSIAYRFNSLKADMSALAVESAPELMSAFESLIEALTTAGEMFQSLSPGMRDFLVKSALVAAVLGPVITVLGGLMKGILLLMKARLVIAGATALAGSFGRTFVLTVGTWLLSTKVGMSLMALFGAGGKVSSKLGPVMSTLGKKLGSVMGRGIALGVITLGLITLVPDIFNWAKEQGAKFSDIGYEVGYKIGSAIRDAINFVIDEIVNRVPFVQIDPLEEGLYRPPSFEEELENPSFTDPDAPITDVFGGDVINEGEAESRRRPRIDPMRWSGSRGTGTRIVRRHVHVNLNGRELAEAVVDELETAAAYG